MQNTLSKQIASNASSEYGHSKVMYKQKCNLLHPWQDKNCFKLQLNMHFAFSSLLPLP